MEGISGKIGHFGVIVIAEKLQRLRRRHKRSFRVCQAAAQEFLCLRVLFDRQYFQCVLTQLTVGAGPGNLPQSC